MNKKILEVSDIKKIFMFSDLDGGELNEIISFSNLKKFGKGEILFFDKDSYSGIFCLLEGAVKLYKISPEGREHIVHFVHPGNIFAEAPLFEKPSSVMNANVTYPVNAMAIEDGTKIIFIPAKPFLQIMENNHNLCLKMLSNLSKRLKDFAEHIEQLTLQDVKLRLAKYIYNEFCIKRDKPKNPADKFRKTADGNFIVLNISKYDLASVLGTVIETLSRTLRRLQEEKIIRVEGKIIYIEDSDSLKKFSEKS